MKLKTFTLLPGPDGRFDDEELVTFLADKKVVTVHEHFYQHAGEPAWALLVSYRDTEPLPLRGVEATHRGPKVDWHSGLTPEEVATFEALRAWRNARAEKEGRPGFLVLTNRHLADIVRKRPTTLEGLVGIPGIGEARRAAYGEELLALLAAQAQVPPDAAG